jgi:hypothetical protein
MEIELQLPITHLTELQRHSAGVGNAKSLLIRLLIGGYASAAGFCIHLDSDIKDSVDVAHSPCMIRRQGLPPHKKFCRGRPNRVKYKLSRILFRHLQRGFTSIGDVHGLMVKALDNLAKSCIVCGGAGAGATLRRASLCSKSDCAHVFKKADPEIRLSDSWQDPPVVALLLAMIYAAARTGDRALLPGCPVAGAANIMQLLNSLPDKADKADFAVEKLPFTLELLGSETADLLSWTCCGYRGFVLSARGALRVPNLPEGTHQFVVANASPELEINFAAHRAKQAASRILFHGTSLDRLYAILCQGLRQMSGTRLAQHGASYGKGIYMAEEPLTSWSYALPNSSLAWSKSRYKNTKVLLGCEFAGGSNTNVAVPGVHVISDASTLMLRYIFLFPSDATAPRAADITPAMLSGIASLR